LAKAIGSVTSKPNRVEGHDDDKSVGLWSHVSLSVLCDNGRIRKARTALGTRAVEKRMKECAFMPEGEQLSSYLGYAMLCPCPFYATNADFSLLNRSCNSHFYHKPTVVLLCHQSIQANSEIYWQLFLFGRKSQWP
jgi:hypothetical protein